MINIGITGQTGFIGTHLYNHLNLLPEKFTTVKFEDRFFEDPELLKKWVKKCDVIVHLAAVNRHSDPKILYETNIGLVNKMMNAMTSTGSKSHIIFASSTQEEEDNLYGKSKKEGRITLFNFATQNNSLFTGLIIPNVFGPFGNPYYNSFIATFSYQLTHNEKPEIKVDGNVKLLYVDNLCRFIINRIKECSQNDHNTSKEFLRVPYDFEKKVSEILTLMENYKKQYIENNIIPSLRDNHEINLFNTFRSYIDHKNRFPVKLSKHIDSRGTFIEVSRLGIGGQVSFSTTLPGITRGNHYHTRKIERFIVIKGKALIELRNIASDQVYAFELDGSEPSFVDMPIWYTHNIKNIGEEELYTLFWINEFYNPDDPDTYFEVV